MASAPIPQSKLELNLQTPLLGGARRGNNTQFNDGMLADFLNHGFAGHVMRCVVIQLERPAGQYNTLRVPLQLSHLGAVAMPL